MSEVKQGDRVRVSYEGTVETARPWRTGDVLIGTRYRVKRDDGLTSNFGVRARGSSYSLEVIEPPEPQYDDYGVYKDADGDIFKFTAEENGWLDFGSDHVYSFDYPTRPLVKIDGQ